MSDNLQQLLDQRERDLELAAQYGTALLEENKDLKEKLRHAKEKLAGMEMEGSYEMKEQIQLLEEANKVLKSKVTILESKNNDLEAKIILKNAQREDLAQNIDELTRKLKNADDRTALLQKELENNSTAGTIYELNEQLEMQKEIIQDLRAKQVEVQRINSELTKKLDEALRQMEKMNAAQFSNGTDPIIIEELKELRRINNEMKRESREKDEIIKELQTRPAEARPTVYQRTIVEVPSYVPFPGNSDGTSGHSVDDLEHVNNTHADITQPKTNTQEDSSANPSNGPIRDVPNETSHSIDIVNGASDRDIDNNKASHISGAREENSESGSSSGSSTTGTSWTQHQHHPRQEPTIDATNANSGSISTGNNIDTANVSKGSYNDTSVASRDSNNSIAIASKDTTGTAPNDNNTNTSSVAQYNSISDSRDNTYGSSDSKDNYNDTHTTKGNTNTSAASQDDNNDSSTDSRDNNNTFNALNNNDTGSDSKDNNGTGIASKDPTHTFSPLHRDPRVPELVAKLAEAERLLSLKSEEVNRLSMKLVDLAERASTSPQTIVNNVILKQKEGYLVKQGARVKNWKRRFFFLESDFLYYSESVKSRFETLGMIRLDSAEVDQAIIPNRLHVIAVKTTDKRTYYLCADTEGEMRDWIKVLKEKIEEIAEKKR